jgi:DNA-binding response OmpR family regulator
MMANILVIEDDEQMRGMLTQMLSQDNHRISVAHDGEDGLRQARDKKPELVITDILMPKMDGIEFIMELNRMGNSTPVIAISGGRRAISAGFNLDSATLMGVKATISKPFSLVELRQAISKALN